MVIKSGTRRVYMLQTFRIIYIIQRVTFGQYRGCHSSHTTKLSAILDTSAVWFTERDICSVRALVAVKENGLTTLTHG